MCLETRLSPGLGGLRYQEFMKIAGQLSEKCHLFPIDTNSNVWKPSTGENPTGVDIQSYLVADTIPWPVLLPHQLHA